MGANNLTLLALVVVTFLATRLIDRLNSPVPRVPPIAAAVPDSTSRSAAPASVEARAGLSRPAYFAVIGFPVGIDQRNRDRRALLRELWYPEYRNLGVTIRAEFVIGLLTYQGDGHQPAILLGLNEEHRAHGDMAFVNAREATRDPYRGDPKCTGEKLVAWFQQVKDFSPLPSPPQPLPPRLPLRAKVYGRKVGGVVPAGARFINRSSLCCPGPSSPHCLPLPLSLSPGFRHLPRRGSFHRCETLSSF
jgi:hypothetical protein